VLIAIACRAMEGTGGHLLHNRWPDRQCFYCGTHRDRWMAIRRRLAVYAGERGTGWNAEGRGCCFSKPGFPSMISRPFSPACFFRCSGGRCCRHN